MPVLSKRALVSFLTFGLLFLVSVSAHAQGDVAAQVLAQINRARANRNLAALNRNPQLDAAAQGHADDLLQHGTSLGHRGSDGSNIAQRIARAGYNGATVGENWAGYRTLDQIMNFWLNDPPHIQNIVNNKYREIGIGVAVRPNGGFIIVTDFGSPQTAQPKIAPAVAAVKPPPPTKAPVKAKPKPTAVPTRKPTAKPTARPPAPPKPVPVKVALVQPPPPIFKPLHVQGKAKIIPLKGRAKSFPGVAEPQADAGRMSFGGALTLLGTLGLGVAIVGHRRRGR